MSVTNIRTILFATDFLESSRLALDYAVALAHRFGATLTMLHATELPPAAHQAEAISHLPSVSRNQAEAYLEAFARGVRRNGITVQTRVEDGDPSEVILNSLQQGGFDLLVLGVHGVHRGVSHLLIGSNVEKILLSASCPTLTVGAHVRGGIDLDLALDRVLYLSDFSEEGALASPLALFFARAFGVPMDTCHLLPDEGRGAEPSERLAARYCEQVRAIVPAVGPEYLDPQCQLGQVLDAGALLERVQSESAALIIMGVHGTSFLDRHLRSSLAYRLIACSTCPVVTLSRLRPG